MTRPCGPEPSMRPISIPASFAKRRASGEEKTRLAAWPLARGASFEGFGCVAEMAAAARRPCLGLAPRRRPAQAWGLRGARHGFGPFRLRGALPGRCRGGLHVLAFLRHHRDQLIDRHVGGAFRHHDLGQRAVFDGLVFHRRLVGLDLGDHVAGLDRIALLLEPLGKVALLHRGRQCRHEDVDGHGSTTSPNQSQR